MRERIAPGRFSSPKKRPGPEAKSDCLSVGAYLRTTGNEAADEEF